MEADQQQERNGGAQMGRPEQSAAEPSHGQREQKAPHLDQQYTVFGKVLRGDAVLSELEQVKTKKEGIFVMPLERITITRAYVVGSERAPR